MKKVNRKNPASPAEVIKDYPIRAWIDTTNERSFNTVTLEIAKGRYLSALDFAPHVRATAASKEKAESAVLALYQDLQDGRKANSGAIEDDEADAAFSRARANDGQARVPWSEIKRKMTQRRHVGNRVH